MKKTARFISLFLALLTLLSMLSLTCLADGSSNIKCKTSASVGEDFSVTVTLKLGSEDGEIWGAQGNFSFDAAILEYVGATGAVANASGGDIKFTVAGTGAASADATFNFKVISAGKCIVSANSLKYSGGASNSSYNVAGSSVAVNVKNAQAAPENTNAGSAELSSLRISGTELSPAFSKGQTEYTAQVKYPVEKVSITAVALDSAAKISGTGSVSLSVGDNKCTVTVTSTSGTKKSYNINIKRLSEAETAQAEAAEQVVSPLNITIDEKDYTIAQDISALPVPQGYTASTEALGEIQVGVLKDDGGKYILYYITDAAGEGSFCMLDSNGAYVKPSYLYENGRLYIIEENSDVLPPSGFYTDVLQITSGYADVYRSENTDLSDFCWLYAYYNGKSEYFRYDTADKIVQRAPDFSPLPKTAQTENTGFSLANISTKGKLLLGLAALAAICLIALLVLVIVKATRNEDEYLVDFDEDIASSEQSLDFDFGSEVDITGFASESKDASDKTE